MGIIEFNKKIVNKLVHPVQKSELMEGIERVLDDEEIIGSVIGVGDGMTANFRIRVEGVLVLTPKRVLFYYTKSKGGYGTEEYSLDKISSVNFAINKVLGKVESIVEIFSNNNVLKVISYERSQKSEEVRDFVKSVKQYIEEYKKENIPVLNNNLDVVDQISKLAELRDKGTLTEEEFTIQKRKLLGL